MEYKVVYGSNNSGGSWWLGEDNWLALEKAGWVVEWGGKYYCHSTGYVNKRILKVKNLPNHCPSQNGCPGHRIAESLAEAKALEDALFGGYARRAYLLVTSDSLKLAMRAAITSWESATGMNSAETGCNCCGAPHTFMVLGEVYAAGEEVLQYLYDYVPTSLREACKNGDA